MKQITAFLAALLMGTGFAFANKVSFQNENLSGTVVYNEKAAPGEAIFARMNLKISKNVRKKNDSDVKAVLQLIREDKKIETAQFFFINSKVKRQFNPEMLAAIPISLWNSGEGDFSIKIIFSAGSNETPKELILPFSIEKKEWNKETIEFDEKHSDLRQDMTPERLAQIEKLNKLLGTINSQNSYSTKAFGFPVKNPVKQANCGDRRTYVYANGKTETALHYGNDYEAPEGTDVYSCSDGKVVLAEFRISTGWTAVIEHLPGLYSQYNHLSMLSVKEGDSVKQGEKIGLSGSTGLVTGPHLHWEVRLNKAPVVPEFFMKNFAFNEGE